MLNTSIILNPAFMGKVYLKPYVLKGAPSRIRLIYTHLKELWNVLFTVYQLQRMGKGPETRPFIITTCVQRQKWTKLKHWRSSSRIGEGTVRDTLFGTITETVQRDSGKTHR